METSRPMIGETIFIGELSKRTNVPIKTIRYYEDLGILVKPKRTSSEYRVYTQRDIDKLIFVKKAKEVGLTLNEIKDILLKSGQGVRPCCDFVQVVFNRKIKEYEKKIAELSAIKEKLESKVKSWIQPEEAKHLKYTICPHIETDEADRKKKSLKKGRKEK